MKDKELVEGMAKEILLDYAPDWKMVWGSESECLNGFNQIRIDESKIGCRIYYVYEVIIHEIAHIVEDVMSNSWNAHDSDFYDRMGELLGNYSILCERYSDLQREELKRSDSKGGDLVR